jgi:hypothetical protein
MSEFRRLYQNSNWRDFAMLVRERDNHRCTKCGRGKDEVVLQVHHTLYKEGLKPWEYAMANCETLCKGCHASIHGLIEPSSGWTLISINDLGDLTGKCERKGCGSSIRYEYLVYSPGWGYQVVGSTCVDILTQDDKLIVQEIDEALKSIKQIVNSKAWKWMHIQNTLPYQYLQKGRNFIQIFGNKDQYEFKIHINEGSISGKNHQIFKTINVPLDQVKEVAAIIYLGRISESHVKELYSNLYKVLSKSITLKY